MEKLIQKKPVSVLLIDDQHIIAEAVKRIIHNETDIEFHWCQDPTDALTTAIAYKPTVILQDLMMPDIDGLMLVKYFRAHHETKNIPLVVLSVKDDPMIKARAFAEGADDYMVKLPDKEEFLARIRYHSKAYISFLERNYAFEQLEESQKALKKEIDDAAEYVLSILPPPFVSPHISTAWRFIPSTVLGGDIFGYHLLDKDHFALYLIDVCGHGVGAALLSISAANVLREKSPVGFDFLDPKSILTRLNDLFPMEKHNNMFFSMWYGIYNIQKKIITYVNAGHPPAIIKTIGQKQCIQLTNPGVMIGAMPKVIYENAYLELTEPSRLYLFSDGVYEQELISGQTTSLNDFLSYLSRLPEGAAQEDIEKILTFSLSEKKIPSFDDDFSLVITDFNF